MDSRGVRHSGTAEKSESAEPIVKAEGSDDGEGPRVLGSRDVGELFPDVKILFEEELTSEEL